MSSDVIDFNEKVYQTALELAEARCASEDVLQGLTTMHGFTNDALEDTDMMERFADLLTGGTEARSHAADVLSALQSQSVRLVTDAAGRVVGRRTTPDGGLMYSGGLLSVDVLHSGDIWLELVDGYSNNLKGTKLPCTRILISYYNSLTSDRKYVYSLWVTAYLTVLSQNILRYNIPTSVPFMDEEG